MLRARRESTEVTFSKLSAICQNNGKLVDYINKKVDKTVSAWKRDKDHFKKLTWAEMDDSDLALDLDITLPPKDTKTDTSSLVIAATAPPTSAPVTATGISTITPLVEGSNDKKDKYDSFNPFDDKELIVSQIDENAADAAPVDVAANADIAGNTDKALDASMDTVDKQEEQEESMDIVEGCQMDEDDVTTNINTNTDTNTNPKDTSNPKTKKRPKTKRNRIRDKLRIVEQKVMKTSQIEQERTTKKKESQRLRMERAEQRKQEQHQMQRQKNRKYRSKQEEIRMNSDMEKELDLRRMKQRQIKAERKKQKINKDRKQPMIEVHKKLKKMEKLNQSELKKMEESLQKRFKNAANKRHKNMKQRKNSLIVPPEEMKVEDIDDSKYLDVSTLKRLSNKFLFIPRVVRKSAASDLYGHIEAFYEKTLLLLSPKNRQSTNSLKLEEIIKVWLSSTNSLNFKERKYDRDVLLVMNRLLCFDLNKLCMKTSKLMLKMLSSLTKNRMALELLAFKYTKQLLSFYKGCLEDYFHGNRGHQASKAVLPQLSSVLVRCLLNTFDVRNGGDRDYKRFKKHSQSLMLLNLYKSSFLVDIQDIEQCINHRILDGILNILVPIPVILKKHYAVNRAICDLMNHQIEQTQSVQIMQCLSNIMMVVDDDSKNNKRSVSLIGKCFQFGADLIASNSWNRTTMQGLVLKNNEKFQEIMIMFLEHICVHFKVDHDCIFEATKQCLQFVTMLTLEHSKEVQGLFDEELLQKLCNVPFYFMLQPKGQNVLFPAIIGVTFQNEDNLKVMQSSLDPKHLELWLKHKILSSSESDCNQKHKKMKHKKQEILLPSNMWSQCLQFYRV